MSTHNEHRATLERELRNSGIKPEIERTEGGHMRLKFEAGGRKHFVLTSWTPSDNRTTLNARAMIRKILREHKVLDAAKPATKLSKALALPAPSEPFAERIERMEGTIATLLDMLADVAAKVGISLEAPPPVVAQPEPVAVEPVLQLGRGPVGKAPKSKAQELLLCIEYDWTPIKVIREREPGRTRGAISVALDKLKKAGLIENRPGKIGLWRKVRQRAEQPTVVEVVPVMPVVPAPRTPVPVAPQCAVLDVMGFAWMSRGEIERRSGLSGQQLASALSYQKRCGNVENGLRGMWRKRRVHVNGHANGASHHGARP